MNDRAVSALTGDALAGPARVGLVQDFAETLLSGVLARFAALNPDTQLQVRVGGSQELLEALETDRLDVVLCMGASDDVAAIRVAPAIWLGEDHLVEADVLPIAVLERPCRFRDAALAALEAASRPYRSCWKPRASRCAGRGERRPGRHRAHQHLLHRAVGRDAAGLFPRLPQVAYVRHTRTHPHPTIGRLADLMGVTRPRPPA